MRRILIAVGLCAALVGAAAAGALHHGLRPYLRLAYQEFSAAQHGYSIARDLMVAMPDGTRLATDLYLPHRRDRRLPTVLVRSPYGKSGYGDGILWARRFAPEGYAVVIQDMRGRFGSEGVFAPWGAEAADGAATIDWILAQPWSNGRVGTAGCSALGESQAVLATKRHHAHAAMIAESAGGAIGRGGASRSYFGVYEGGVFNLAAGFGWFAFHGGKTADAMAAPDIDPAQVLSELPTGELAARHRDTPTDYDDFVSRFEDDGYWDSLGYLNGGERFSTPALHVTTWHDLTLTGAFEVAALMRANASSDAARRAQHLIVGPGEHCAFDRAFADGRVGDLPVDRGAALDYVDLYRKWFAHLLLDAPSPDLPAYLYYVLRGDRWEKSDVWPPAGAVETRLHLSADGGLRSVEPGVGAVAWTYDPRDPTPSLGGPICCTGDPTSAAGPMDQRPNAARADVATFLSAPLDQPLTIVGDLRAELTVSSTAPDTDIVAVLVDVEPDGAMLAIQHGALRLRYRDGFDRPRLLSPGERARAVVPMRQIAYEVPRGHRIGLQISSSSFPRLERNLNGGGPNHLETAPVAARNTLHLGAEGPSVLVLPILERVDERAGGVGAPTPPPARQGRRRRRRSTHANYPIVSER